MKSKTLLILSVAIILVVVLAVSIGSYKGNSQSIRPQSSMYTVTVVDLSNYPINGANVKILIDDSTWANMGNTNEWGQVSFSGWQGIQVQAQYNGASANGVLVDQPQTLTISLPVTVPHVATPQPTPYVQKYAFIIGTSPDQTGIVGVQDSTGAMNLDSYPAGTVLTLNAVPAVSGYRFHHYAVNGEYYSSDASTTYTTTAGSTTIIAYFMPADATTDPTTNPTSQPTEHPTPSPTFTWTQPTPTPKPGFFEWLYNLLFGWLK